MEQKAKIYVGRVTEKQTQYGDELRIGLSPEDVEKLNAEFARKNGGWVNLIVRRKKEIVAGKPTHYIMVDQWEPTQKKDGYFNDASRVVIPGEEEVF